MMIGNTFTELITPPFTLLPAFICPLDTNILVWPCAQVFQNLPQQLLLKLNLTGQGFVHFALFHGNANRETRCSMCCSILSLHQYQHTYLHQNSFITLTSLHQIAFNLIKTVKTLQLFYIFNELYLKEMNGSAVNFKIFKIFF